MKNFVRKSISKILKSRKFWIGFGIVLVVSILVDLFLLPVVVYQHVSSQSLNPALLSIAVVSSFLSALSKQLTNRRATLMKISQLLWIVVVIWSMREYVFTMTLYLIAAMFLCTRILKFIFKRLNRLFSKRERLRRIS